MVVVVVVVVLVVVVWVVVVVVVVREGDRKTGGTRATAVWPPCGSAATIWSG